MSVYAAASETEALVSVGTNTSNVTTGNCVVADVNRAAMRFSARNDGYVDLSTPISEGWLHARLQPTQSGSAPNFSNADFILSVRDTDGNIVAGFYQDENNTVSPIGWRASKFGDTNLYTVNGAAGTSIGTASGAYDVDLYFKISDTVGVLEWYVNGSLVRSFSGDTKPGSAANVGSVRIAARGTASGTDNRSSIEISQVLVSNVPTVGARVHSLELSAGSVNQWAGSVTDINAADETRSSVMYETTPGDQALFAASNVVSINSGNSIAAVVMSTSAQSISGSPVTKLRGRVRVSGTDYTIGSDVTLTTGFLPARFIAETNPATSLPWTLSEVNAAEIGFQAQS